MEKNRRGRPKEIYLGEIWRNYQVTEKSGESDMEEWDSNSDTERGILSKYHLEFNINYILKLKKRLLIGVNRYCKRRRRIQLGEINKAKNKEETIKWTYLVLGSGTGNKGKI